MRIIRFARFLHFTTNFYTFLHFLHLPIAFQRTWSERTLVCNIMELRCGDKKTFFKLFLNETADTQQPGVGVNSRNKNRTLKDGINLFYCLLIVLCERAGERVAAVWLSDTWIGLLVAQFIIAIVV